MILVLVLCHTNALAHPGIGIVMDKRGNVYYTDLKHIWRISPAGEKSIAVRDVHTHELYVDSLDNLYGEHLWYEGDATKKWGHRVWRLSADGNLKDIIASRPGFLDDYDDFHFVRDGAGAMYWVDRGKPTVVRKRTADGRTVSLATSNFRNVRWMTVTRDGIVYLIDLHDLVRVTADGNVQTIVQNLADRGRSFLLTTDIHAVMGLWTDLQGNVYAAVYSDKAVKKVSPEGRVEVVVRSGGGWSPTGGFIASSGDLWLLEYGTNSGVRVRRIDKSGKSTVF